MSVIENDVTIVNEGPVDQEKKERTEDEDFLFSFLNKNEDVAPYQLNNFAFNNSKSTIAMFEKNSLNNKFNKKKEIKMSLGMDNKL